MNRRHRPVFQGERFVVLDWQVDDLTRMLGRQIEQFDLFGWFFTLDAELAKSGDVLPPRTHQWLSERTFEEARRRGLPMAQTSRFGKFSTRLLTAIHNNRRKVQP